MRKVRLREAARAREDGSEAAEAIELRPLPISGVVVHRAALIEALRVYLPSLTDIQVTEDGESFWLMLKGGEVHEDTATQQES